MGILELFLLSIMVSLAVIFIWACFQEGMVLGFLQQKLHWLPEWLQKPLFGCLICMTPWYGCIVLAINTNLFSISEKSMAMVLMVSSGINVILSPIVHKLHGID